MNQIQESLLTWFSVIMESSEYSDDDLTRAYARLWSSTLPNGQIVRPLRGFPSAVYFSWAKRFKRMASGADAGGSDHLVHSNGSTSDPTVSEIDTTGLPLDDCQIINRFDIGPDHVRLLYNRQEKLFYDSLMTQVFMTHNL